MYVYGPVPSRRLGRSLGVSPIPPKTCSYTCVYCQLGRTTNLQSERESFYPREDILNEIIEAGKKVSADYITFVGDGEPTLCRDLGWLIKQTKAKLEIPAAVITNGSLLYLEEVRGEMAEADVVMPTLDAGNEITFRKINRPHRDIRYTDMIDGLVSFRREYSGQIWVEVMLVKGINDTAKELIGIKKVLDKIDPDRVYVLTPIRPPAESWVEPSEPESILRAQEIIGKVTTVAAMEEGHFDLGGFDNARQAILEIGSRHPLRRRQAAAIEKELSQPGVVEQMIAGEELVEIDYKGEKYLLPEHFKMGKKKEK